jgi:hypothetical protein
VDPFACRNELGHQHATRYELQSGELRTIIGALAQDDPVFALREALALGDDLRPLTERRFRWFVLSQVEEPVVHPAVVGADAVRRLAGHFRAEGQTLTAYRQVDDIWSIARHRTFLARRASEIATAADDAGLARWADEHASPLAQRWSHMAPLLMQATLAIEAGRPASSSVPDTLELLADLECAAAEALPVESIRLGRLDRTQLRLG